MIDKWFKQDIDEALAQHKRMVITDNQREGSFLLGGLPYPYTILKANNEVEELHARYVAEKEHADEPVVFYTTMGKEGLKYLLEYAETGGLVNLDNMETYIKNKIWEHLEKNVNLSKQELLLAAKVCHGKDEKWWIKVADGLESPFDLMTYLTDFLAAPEDTAKLMDPDVWAVFQAQVYQMIGMTATNQPARTLATEVMKAIFDGLVNNQIGDSLMEVYQQMTDRQTLQPAFERYLSSYDILKGKSPWEMHPDHPFAFYDEEMMRQLGKRLEDHTSTEVCLDYINHRLQTHCALAYKASWLKSLRTLLTFTTKGMKEVDTTADFACYYQQHYAALDTAMRKIYKAWLNEQSTLKPIQYLYEQYEKELLDKWFSLSKQYQATQQDFLIKTLTQSGRIAVIVGDGLRLCIAHAVADNYPDKKLIIVRNTMFAVLPSVTENGMSALYGCEEVTTHAQERIKHLQEVIPTVMVMDADQLNNSVTAEKLVLRFGDIDQIGEKKQLSGLKDIDHYECLITEMIQRLMEMGYHKVYLTTDHGFVLTGILDDADKVPVPNQPVMKVEERYLLAEDPVTDNTLIERKSDYMGSHFQYYAQTDHPFRTTGSYGYAHGGFTPQECIIPAYEFAMGNMVGTLTISIINKKDLGDIASDTFMVKLKAEGDSSNLFEAERKFKVLVFVGGKQVSCSAIRKIKAGQTIDDMEFSLEGDGKMVVIDAESKAQLDSATIKKSSARDLGDLL